MAGLEYHKQILKRINLLRRELEDHLNNAEKPTEDIVVKISQELDKLIVEYYRLTGKELT